MEDQHIKLHHNFTEGNPSEVIIRTGEAAEIHDPVKVQHQGIITAPAEFLTKRKDQCKAEFTHIVMNKQRKTIVLRVDETNKFGAEITGTLKKDKFLSSLKINSTESYSIADLSKALRFARRHFANAETHRALLLKLRNFTTKITQTTTQSDDRQGNKMNSFESKVSEFATANDLGFSLFLPLFEGTDKVNIPITIEVDVTNGQVVLFLVCDALDEMEDDLVGRIFNEQKQVFAEYAIIEQ